MQRMSSNPELLESAKKRSLKRGKENASNATPLYMGPRELNSVKNVFRMNRNKEQQSKCDEGLGSNQIMRMPIALFSPTESSIC